MGFFNRVFEFKEEDQQTVNPVRISKLLGEKFNVGQEHDTKELFEHILDQINKEWHQIVDDAKLATI